MPQFLYYIGNFNWNGDASDSDPVGFTSWAVDQPETTVINACIELRSALNFEQKRGELFLYW